MQKYRDISMINPDRKRMKTKEKLNLDIIH
jgi:hypothetical protein